MPPIKSYWQLLTLDQRVSVTSAIVNGLTLIVSSVFLIIGLMSFWEAKNTTLLTNVPFLSVEELEPMIAAPVKVDGGYEIAITNHYVVNAFGSTPLINMTTRSAPITSTDEMPFIGEDDSTLAKVIMPSEIVTINSSAGLKILRPDLQTMKQLDALAGKGFEITPKVPPNHISIGLDKPIFFLVRVRYEDLLGNKYEYQYLTQWKFFTDSTGMTIDRSFIRSRLGRR